MKFYLINEKRYDYLWTADLIMRILRMNIEQNEKTVLIGLVLCGDGFCIDSELFSFRCGISEEDVLSAIKGLVYKSILIVDDKDYSIYIDYDLFVEIKNEKKKQNLAEEQGRLSKVLDIKKTYDDKYEVNI